MRRALTVFAAVPLFAALQAGSARAQVPGDTLQTRGLAWSVSVGSGSVPFAGIRPVSADVVVASLAWERTVVRLGALEVRYAPAFIPVVSFRNVILNAEPTGLQCNVPGPCTQLADVSRTSRSGVGVSPLGLVMAVHLGARASLVASTHVSALLLDGPAPYTNQTGATWMLDGALGARVRLGDVTSLDVEWVRTSLANGAFVLDDRAMKTSGLRVGLTRAHLAPFPRIAADSAGSEQRGWTLTAGAGAFSPIAGFSNNAQLTTLAWRWERAIAGDGDLALSAGAEFLPLVLARADKLVLPARARCSSGSCPVIDSYTTPAVGVGLAPLALRFHGSVSPSVQLWGDASAGGVAFDRAYPVRDANRLNFLLGAGAGFAVNLNATRALSVGYRLQHLSNGFTADRNPGVNYHALVLALQRIR
jgi:hypothetical protein